MVFDAESKSVLHTEMAKKNLFVKRGGIAYYYCLFFFGVSEEVLKREYYENVRILNICVGI
jgi:hypothetical protein